MLRRNLWISARLVSGSFGQVSNMVYLPVQSTPAFPHFVLCTFPQYTWPPFISNLPHSLAIVPLTHLWNTNNGSFSCLASTITIHKCQGLTVNQAIVDLIGTREQPAGLSFVAILGVRRLTNVVLQPFAFGRISRLGVAPSVLASLRIFICVLHQHPSKNNYMFTKQFLVSFLPSVLIALTGDAVFPRSLWEAMFGRGTSCSK